MAEGRNTSNGVQPAHTATVDYHKDWTHVSSWMDLELSESYIITEYFSRQNSSESHCVNQN